MPCQECGAPLVYREAIGWLCSDGRCGQIHDRKSDGTPYTESGKIHVKAK